MPELDTSVVITIVVAIFSAGITWGVMVYKNRSLEGKFSEFLIELKEVVKELRNLTTELHIMKASNVRNERDIEQHEQRIAALESAMIKLQAQIA